MAHKDPAAKPETPEASTGPHRRDYPSSGFGLELT